jgi:hypothetical protein
MKYLTILFTMLFVSVSIVSTQPVQAANIAISSGSVSYDVDDIFNIDLIVSDLSEFDSETLGAFDVNLFFDSALLALTEVRFGNFLGVDTAGEVLQGATVLDNFLNLFSVSLLENSDTDCIFCTGHYLQNIQSSNFLLLTLSFQAVSAGIVDFSLQPLALSGGDGTPLHDADSSDNFLSISIGARSISEPSAIFLFVFGLLAVTCKLRRNMTNAY